MTLENVSDFSRVASTAVPIARCVLVRPEISTLDIKASPHIPVESPENAASTSAEKNVLAKEARLVPTYSQYENEPACGPFEMENLSRQKKSSGKGKGKEDRELLESFTGSHVGGPDHPTSSAIVTTEQREENISEQGFARKTAKRKRRSQERVKRNKADGNQLTHETEDSEERPKAQRAIMERKVKRCNKRCKNNRDDETRAYTITELQTLDPNHDEQPASSDFPDMEQGRKRRRKRPDNEAITINTEVSSNSRKAGSSEVKSTGPVEQSGFPLPMIQLA